MERDVTRIALFAALIAVLGLVPKIDLVSGVPITAQSLGIMLSGAVLGSKRGALAVLLFLAVVSAGVPLLSGGRGGVAVFVGPTAGYLVGFPIAAFVIGLIVERVHRAPWLTCFVACVIGGILVLNGLGIVGMAIILQKSLPEASLLALPFLVGDLIKSALAATIAQTIKRMRPERLGVGS